MLSSLVRSTPFRLVLLLGSTFLIALALAAASAFVLIRENLQARTDRDLADTYAVIEQSFAGEDLPDLVDLVASHARATVSGREVYLLLAPDGHRLAGNIDRFDHADGLTTLDPGALGLDDGESEYRVLAGHIGDLRLVVGTSLKETEDIGRVVLVVLGWIVGCFALVSLAIGVLLALRGQRRLSLIGATMERIGHGDLTARIPVSGRNDDIDVLVTSVNSALGRLSALVEGMRQVSVDIAHELKTPLNRLSIALNDAVEVVDGDHKALPLLEEIQAEVRQVIAIFDAMLRIAQIESGARKARFNDVSLVEVLGNVAEAYAPVAADSGQSLGLTVSDDLKPVLGDRDLLTQVAANLVENAIRHCPSGTSISLEGRTAGSAATISVSDNGPGIPDADKPRVFDRLYRVEKSRTTPGYGLGLSLVKAVADLHGADVELVDNHPGLTVRLTFPRAGAVVAQAR